MKKLAFCLLILLVIPLLGFEAGVLAGQALIEGRTSCGRSSERPPGRVPSRISGRVPHPDSCLELGSDRERRFHKHRAESWNAGSIAYEGSIPCLFGLLGPYNSTVTLFFPGENIGGPL